MRLFAVGFAGLSAQVAQATWALRAAGAAASEASGALPAAGNVCFVRRRSSAALPRVMRLRFCCEDPALFRRLVRLAGAAAADEFVFLTSLDVSGVFIRFPFLVGGYAICS